MEMSGCWASGLWIDLQEMRRWEETAGSFVAGALPARVTSLILQKPPLLPRSPLHTQLPLQDAGHFRMSPWGPVSSLVCF